MPIRDQYRACLDATAGLRVVRCLAALSLFVQLSSERRANRCAIDCSFAKKQESGPALLLLVRGERRCLAQLRSLARAKGDAPLVYEMTAACPSCTDREANRRCCAQPTGQ